jgi:hypothetical protein
MARVLEHNFALYTNDDWFIFAAGEEFDRTWGEVPQWRHEVAHLKFIRAQTCWLESDIDDLQARRRAGYAIARSALSPTDVPDQDMVRSWSLLGTESVSPGIADAICTLYNEPPVRTFGDTGVDDGMSDVYQMASVNKAMNAAYRLALFTNLVAIVPEWDKKLSLKVIAADQFRYLPPGQGHEEELWILEREVATGRLSFRVLTPTVQKRWYDGKFFDETPHNYGRLPAVMLKLNPSTDVYGAGITEAAEINAWGSVMRFFSTRIAMFQAHSVGVLINAGQNIKPGTRIGPGYILQLDNPGGDASQKPEFTFVSPQGKFTELENYREQALQSFQKNQGLPAFIVDMTGTPPTGIALQIMQRRLTEKRKLHKSAIADAELSLAQLIAVMGAERGRSLLFDPAKFAIEFVGESQPDADELEYDLRRSMAGLMSPSALVEKYMRIRLDDVQAAALLQKNSAFVNYAPALSATATDVLTPAPNGNDQSTS